MEGFRDHGDISSRPFSSEPETRAHATGLEKARDGIAGTLHRAADSLKANAEDSRVPLDASRLGARASTWLHDSAQKIEQIEPTKITRDVTERVRRNPGKSLLVAAGAGLILGALFRRR